MARKRISDPAVTEDTRDLSFAKAKKRLSTMRRCACETPHKVAQWFHGIPFIECGACKGVIVKQCEARGCTEPALHRTRYCTRHYVLSKYTLVRKHQAEQKVRELTHNSIKPAIRYKEHRMLDEVRLENLIRRNEDANE